MNRIDLGKIEVVPHDKNLLLEGFDCGDADLNEFIKRDSFAYEEKKLAKTYVAVIDRKPVGFFSICTDSIGLSKEERFEEFGIGKPHPDYPAIKIARIGVSVGCTGNGIGTALVMNAIGKALEISKNVGCRFVTVDAYPAIAPFYEKKCKFIRNRDDTSGRNVSMRMDLLKEK